VWQLDYSTGFVSKDTLIVDRDTYSGKWPEGFNNPAMQNIHNVGPLPLGDWEISGPPFDDAKHGKYILRLAPKKGTETYKRTGFLWHGKPVIPEGINLLLPSPFICTGSEGCLCSSPVTRTRVYQSGDTFLRTISGNKLQ
jgi:hypothetical protein